MPAVATGVILMTLAQLVVMPANDATVKWLVGTLPILQIAWARFFGNLVLLLPYVLARHGTRALRVTNVRLQILRGGLIVASNLMFIAGVAVVPLADAIALVFVAPLVVTVLAPRMLGEVVGTGRWALVLAGFGGALLIVRPGFNEAGLAALLPLSAALSFAAYLLVTRKLAGSAPPMVTQTVTATVGAVATSLLVPLVWTMPSPVELLLLAVVAVVSCIGHVLITVAHDHAPAATLAPLTYLGLVGAAVLGWLIFAEVPDVATLLGAAIVAGSGLAIWLGELRTR